MIWSFGHLAYPMVLVQIPMYNEKEVCIIALRSFQKKKKKLLILRRDFNYFFIDE